MSFLDEVTEAVKPILTGKPVLLSKPHGRTDLSFRSTIYNALRALGVDAQIKKSAEGFRIIPKTTSVFSSEQVKKVDTIATAQLNLEIGLGAAMLVKHGIVLSFEFVGYSLEEFHEITQQQLNGEIATGVVIEESSLSVKLSQASISVAVADPTSIEDLDFTTPAQPEKD